jgi:tRNA G18 (ribose-2'-O)-methylase SpoU
MEELGRADLATFREQPKTPLVLILDNVRSALNVGSAFRTADAFALQKIYLCGITARPPHREILKTALGATESIEWEYLEEPAAAVRQLQEAGYRVLAIEQVEGSTSLADFQWTDNKPIALVFGNEVQGVHDSTLATVDGALEVPQFGTKHSLNISVCVGVVVWELFRQWKFNFSRGE